MKKVVVIICLIFVGACSREMNETDPQLQTIESGNNIIYVDNEALEELTPPQMETIDPSTKASLVELYEWINQHREEGLPAPKAFGGVYWRKDGRLILSLTEEGNEGEYLTFYKEEKPEVQKAEASYNELYLLGKHLADAVQNKDPSRPIRWVVDERSQMTKVYWPKENQDMFFDFPDIKPGEIRADWWPKWPSIVPLSLDMSRSSKEERAGARYQLDEPLSNWGGSVRLEGSVESKELKALDEWIDQNREADLPTPKDFSGAYVDESGKLIIKLFDLENKADYEAIFHDPSKVDIQQSNTSYNQLYRLGRLFQKAMKKDHEEAELSFMIDEKHNMVRVLIDREAEKKLDYSALRNADINHALVEIDPHWENNWKESLPLIFIYED